MKCHQPSDATGTNDRLPETLKRVQSAKWTSIISKFVHEDAVYNYVHVNDKHKAKHRHDEVERNVPEKGGISERKHQKVIMQGLFSVVCRTRTELA